MNLLTDAAMNSLARIALDKLISCDEPRVLVWDPGTERIRTVSLTKTYVRRMQKKSTVLGTYTSDARVEQIAADLKAVLENLAVQHGRNEE